MYVHFSDWGEASRRLAHLATVFLIVPPVLAGCGNVTEVVANPRPTLGLSVTPDPPTTHTESGNNHVLELAQFVDATVSAQAIRGRISSATDVDVYDLGPVLPGDRVIVDVSVGPALKGVIALFDADGSSLLVNDHRNVYLGRQGPFVDVVIRRESPSCLVAFAGTPGFDSTGDYELLASMQPETQIPAPRPDIFLLDFAGSRNVRIGNRPAVDVPAFNAATISSRYAGLTDRMVAEIVARVRNQFSGFDVTILSTSEGAVPDARMSRVYFGTFDEALLGVADGVDEYNAAQGQNAIIFTDTFDAFASLNPTVSEMAQAIANVASHEIGHLLGLVHTRDSADIMDVTASLRQLLREQSFRRAPIYSAVFPLGSQDSAQMLLDSVGGDPSVLIRSRATPRQRVRDDDVEPSARDFLFLSGCELKCGGIPSDHDAVDQTPADDVP